MLKNYTDISNDKVRRIIQFVMPNGISNFDVRISNSQNHIFRGTAYPDGSRYHNTAKPFIVVRVTRGENAFPYFVRYKSHTRTKLKLNTQSGKLVLQYWNGWIY
jgi:hypothetical protein